MDSRFDQALITKWGPLLASLVATYSIPGRLDPQDLKQELIQSIWKLTTRVDPISKPVDFDRMCRAELRNKCVDWNRHAKARKRMGRTGHAVQCGVCGGVSRLTLSDPLVCKFCNESENVRDVETYAKDVSLQDVVNYSEKEKHESSSDVLSTSYAPMDNMIVDEMLEEIRNGVTGKDEQLFKCLVDPPAEFLQIMSDAGFTGDHRTAPLFIFSRYLGIPEREVSVRMRKIKAAVAKMCTSLSKTALSRRSESRPRAKSKKAL